MTGPVGDPVGGPPPEAPAAARAASLEVSGRDAAVLPPLRGALPAGTRVSVAQLPKESSAERLAAVRAVLAQGWQPVLHVAARRLASRAELDAVLGGLAAVGGAEEVFVVGGDPSTPRGPFPDALSVISSGLLAEHGVRAVGVASYPEEHPGVPTEVLARALHDKLDACAASGLAASITTQFAFDAERVLDHVAELRALGVDVPVRIGLPGPAGAARLLGYARRCGVGTSAGVLRKYGLSAVDLAGRTGPDRLVEALERGYRVEVHGDVALHVHSFGDPAAAVRWLAGRTTALDVRPA